LAAHVEIPETANGNKPFITGGLLKGRFVAEAFHFHWGSPSSRGSEHSINQQRFDVEMHIVHRNEKYGDIDEAKNKKDGIAVIGVMLKIVKVSIYLSIFLRSVIVQGVVVPRNQVQSNPT